MPQFTYRATDRDGHDVHGSISATDMVVAAEAIRKLLLTPVELQQMASGDTESPIREPASSLPASPSPSSAVAPTTRIPSAIDLTQPYSALDSTWFGAAKQAEDVEGEGRRSLEPWERSIGGAEQQAAPASTNTADTLQQTSDVEADLSGAGCMETHGVRGGRAGTVPYGERGEHRSSFRGALEEHLILPLRMRRAQQEMAVFYREFAALVGAGIPLYQALAGLEANTSSPVLKEFAHEGAKQVQAGGRLSNVMQGYSWVFPQMHIELVRAAETGGMLDEVFRRLAAYTEHDLDIRRLISRETLHPKIVLVVALMLLGAPGLVIGSGRVAVVDLVVQGNVIGYLVETVGFGALCLLAFYGCGAFLRLTSFNVAAVREAIEVLKVSVPGPSGLVKMFASAKFLRTAAALYRGGFGMQSCLQIAGDSCGNTVLQRAAHEAAKAAEAGMAPSEALRESGFLSPMAVSMFRTGEVTGDLDQILDKNADYFEDEAKMLLHRACMIGSAVIFLIVAIYIGCIIISFYTGMAGNSAHLGGAAE